MELRIYGKPEVTEEPSYLKLELAGDGVNIVVCDTNGDTEIAGYLLKITNAGNIKRHSGVSCRFGFQLDDDGRILLDK